MAEGAKNERKHRSRQDGSNVRTKNRSLFGNSDLRFSNAAQLQATENAVFMRQLTPLFFSEPVMATGPTQSAHRKCSDLITMSIIFRDEGTR